MVSTWPTRAMGRFAERFQPWAEERIAHEVAQEYPELSGVPGSLAEASVEIFGEVGAERAREYMTERVRQGLDWMKGEQSDPSRDRSLETILSKLLDASARRGLEPRKGFDKRRFSKLVLGELESAGHSCIKKVGNVIIGTWSAGEVSVETQVTLKPGLSYLHIARTNGELACLQVSLMTWLGLDAATRYEPGRQHSPEGILSHMRRQWDTFLSAAPTLAVP